MQGEKFRNPIQADGKVVIITGSNTGIGKETALELAKRKATVYLACRDLAKCEEARKSIILESKNRNVYCRQLDLASFESIKNFVKHFKSEQVRRLKIASTIQSNSKSFQNRLDILINNAGVMRCPRMVTTEGFEMQIGVNHMGHFLLTHLLLDFMKVSTPSRIVNVSSIAHTRGEINTADLNSEKSYDPAKAYEQSKLANVLFTRELAKRLDGSGVTVNSLHPGIVDTELMRHMGVFNSFFAKIIVYPLMWPFLKTAVNGAQTSLYVALDPDLEKVTGKYFSDCKQKEVAAQGQDDSMANFLWKVSEKWCRLD